MASGCLTDPEGLYKNGFHFAKNEGLRSTIHSSFCCKRLVRIVAVVVFFGIGVGVGVVDDE